MHLWDLTLWLGLVVEILSNKISALSIIAEVGNSPPTISVGREDAFFTEDMGV
jgi:hypothetical protein